MMRKIIFSLATAVALTGAAAPALSYTGVTKLDTITTVNDRMSGNGNSTTARGYWTSSSEYYVSTSGGNSLVRSDGRKLRRVMITGYHPVEGFASEIAAEAQTTARLDARSTR